jgi:hypothetical protein
VLARDAREGGALPTALEHDDILDQAKVVLLNTAKLGFGGGGALFEPRQQFLIRSA